MSARWCPERVLVYRHPVDMRKQIDGLSELVAAELDQNPSDRTAYVFVSRCSRRVKVLIWHLNGYWLLGVDTGNGIYRTLRAYGS